MIKNFDIKRIVACSYDFRIEQLFKQKRTDKIVHEKNLPEMKEIKMPYILKPGELILARTVEEIEMPMDLMGLSMSRGPTYRLGLVILASIVPPGYKGKLVFSIYNSSPNKIRIDKNLATLQIVFEELKGENIKFKAKYEGGKLL